MARKLTKRELNALVSALVRQGLKTCDIYLFGSTAKGFATRHSDRDFCIVVPDGTSDIDGLWVKLTTTLGLKGFDFDLVIVTQSDYRTNKISPILHEIRKTGIKVHTGLESSPLSANFAR
jgi:predicted nucleotidyltransferase